MQWLNNEGRLLSKEDEILLFLPDEYKTTTNDTRQGGQGISGNVRSERENPAPDGENRAIETGSIEENAEEQGDDVREGWEEDDGEEVVFTPAQQALYDAQTADLYKRIQAIISRLETHEQQWRAKKKELSELHGKGKQGDLFGMPEPEFVGSLFDENEFIDLGG